MKKKYLLIGGEVISKNDGDRHYVSAYKLLRLYRLGEEICDCIEAAEESLYRRSHPNNSLIVLRPRFDGRYGLPDQVVNEH